MLKHVAKENQPYALRLKRKVILIAFEVAAVDRNTVDNLRFTIEVCA